MLVIGELQLIRVLKKYVSYFNPARPHQGIAQRIPAPRVPPSGMPKTSGNSPARCCTGCTTITLGLPRSPGLAEKAGG